MSEAYPRVTVGIPTWNRAGYLREAIASVLAQTYTSFVLHICDNGSTDETQAVVASFDDTRIVYHRNAVNDGWINNFNRLFEVSRSTEYVVVLGDDDLLHPDALELAVAEMDAHPNVGMRHSAFDVIDSDGAVLAESANWLGDRRLEAITAGHDFIRVLMSHGVLCASTAMVRTAALPRIPFEDRYEPATDFALWLRIALEWDIAYSSAPMCQYRMHGSSDSARWNRLTAAGYAGSYRYDLRMRRVKRRFLDANADHLGDVRHLRRVVQWSAIRRVIGRTLGPRIAEPLKSMAARIQRRDGHGAARSLPSPGSSGQSTEALSSEAPLHVVMVMRQRASASTGSRPAPEVEARAGLRTLSTMVRRAGRWMYNRAEAGVGGPQVHVANVQAYLESQGHVVSVVTPFAAPWPLHFGCATIGWSLHQVSTSRAEAWRRFWHARLIAMALRSKRRTWRQRTDNLHIVYYTQCPLSAHVASRQRVSGSKVVLVGH